jgi:hypothetical protein
MSEKKKVVIEDDFPIPIPVKSKKFVIEDEDDIPIPVKSKKVVIEDEDDRPIPVKSKKVVIEDEDDLSVAIKSTIKKFLQEIYDNPYLLPGSGTEHEEIFEKLLKERGIPYVRNPNGTQQSPDFILFHKWLVELKSTKSDHIMLNDGFFDDDVIYIISRTKKSQIDSIIALGKDVYIDDEKEALTRFRADIRRLRKVYKDVRNLFLYPRAANRYNLNSLDRVLLFDALKTGLE